MKLEITSKTVTVRYVSVNSDRVAE